MRIYVGGISYATNNDGLRRLFETVGNVADVNIVEDRFSGQSKGFGFVDMPDDAQARTAITQFNGRVVDGRTLTVNEAKPREDRGAGFAGGARSGGGRGGYGGGGGGGRY